MRRVNSIKQLVAGVVAEGVVDLLEPVQIHHHDVAVVAVRRLAVDRREVALEGRAVRETRQRIVLGLELHLAMQHAPAEARRELIRKTLRTVEVVGVEGDRRRRAPGHDHDTHRPDVVVDEGDDGFAADLEPRNPAAARSRPVVTTTARSSTRPVQSAVRSMSPITDTSGRGEDAGAAVVGDDGQHRVVGAQDARRFRDRRFADLVEIEGSTDSPGEAVDRTQVAQLLAQSTVATHHVPERNDWDGRENGQWR